MNDAKVNKKLTYWGKSQPLSGLETTKEIKKYFSKLKPLSGWFLLFHNYITSPFF